MHYKIIIVAAVIGMVLIATSYNAGYNSGHDLGYIQGAKYILETTGYRN